MVFIIGIIVVLFLVFLSGVFSASSELNDHCKKIGLKPEDVFSYDRFKIIDGIHIPLHSECYLLFHKNGLYIIHSKGTFLIDKDRFYGAHQMSNKQILETYQNNKSVIGRSLVGGMIFGGTGAVIGAISATKPEISKKTTEEKSLVINYVNSQNEFSSLIFSQYPKTLDIENCIKIINDKFVKSSNDIVTQL